MRQAMDPEAPRVALLLQDEQQGLAPTVGPLHQQGHVQLAETLAKPLLALLLTDRKDLGLGKLLDRVAGSKESQCLAWIVQDRILEVLVVTHVLVPIPSRRSSQARREWPNRRYALD